jgi:hypothetical protein
MQRRPAPAQSWKIIVRGFTLGGIWGHLQVKSAPSLTSDAFFLSSLVAPLNGPADMYIHIHWLGRKSIYLVFLYPPVFNCCLMISFTVFLTMC